MRSLLIAVVFALPASLALAQSRGYNESVHLETFNQATNTYGGYVNINASPCANVSYNINLPFGDAKNGEDAKKKLKAQVGKIGADIKAAAANCHH